MLSPEEVAVRVPADERSAWHSLLANNQYAQVENRLEKAHARAVDGAEVEKAALLAAARQLCASCQQLQQEVTFHQQAYQESETRRDQMDAELNKLLQIAEVRPEAAESVEPPTLWQRLQSFFSRVSKLGPKTKRRAETDKKGEAKSAAQRKDERIEKAAHTFNQQAQTAVNPAQLNSRSKSSVAPGSAQLEPGRRSLMVYSFGAFRVYLNERPLNDWNGLKSLLILKYLVANRCSPVAKDILMDVFWPDADSEGARRNLHQAVYSLRQTLKKQDPHFQHILYENDCYLLNPEMAVWLDFREFESNIRQGRSLMQAGKYSAAMGAYGIAESLYQGKFLAEDLYEEWPRAERQRLQDLYLEIADRLSAYYVEQGELIIAITLSQKILQHDKCFEQAYYRLMLCYHARGQRHLAIRAYLNCKDVLNEELGLLPAKETAELYSSLIN